MRGYTLGDVAVAEASGVVVGDGNNAMFGAGSYIDTGCVISSSCLECPLVVCVEDVGSQRNGSFRAIDRAIAQSWDEGVRDPRLAQVYAGPAEHIPEDVGAVPASQSKRDRDAAILRMRAAGKTYQVIANSFGLHFRTVEKVCQLAKSREG